MAEHAEAPPRRSARLRSRLLALVLLGTVPLAALSVLSAVNDRRAAADDAYRRTTEIVDIGAVVAEGIVSQTDLLLGAVGQLSTPLGSVCRAELPAAIVPDSIYRNIYSVAADGRVMCTARGEPRTTDVADTDWFRRTTQRQALTVAVPAPGLVADDTALIIARPRPRSLEVDEQPAATDGDVGLLAASLDPQVLVGFATTIDLPPGSVVQVVNGEGVVVARNVDHESYDLRPTPEFDQIDGQTSGVIDDTGLDGVGRLYSFERVDVGGEPLYVMAGLSREEAYGNANGRLLWSVVVIAVLGVGVAAVALGAGRSLVAQPVERLRAAIAGFRSGDITRRAGDIGGPAEVVELGVAFDAMADEIQDRLTTQERLLDQIEEASEAERQSIAAGIHDETLQNLSAARIQVQLVRRTADDAQRRQLDQTIELLDETVSLLRDLLFDLRPPAFDRIGLTATLRETLEVRFRSDLDDWSVTGEPDPSVPDDTQILLYRVAQQALANVREHAAAHRVDIRIATHGSTITMEITDDGQGFDPELIDRDVRPGHIGLRVMRDRTRAAGGDMVVTSTPGGGTTVRVVVPFVPRTPS